MEEGPEPVRPSPRPNRAHPANADRPGDTLDARLTLVGRVGELQSAAAFLDEMQAGPCGLVLEGEAGIGKTTVWAEVAARGQKGARVLFAHPAEAEAQLGFAALADLMEPVLDELAPALPEPQRHALAVALLREQPGPGRLDQRAVSAAVLSVLRTLAAAGPLLVAMTTCSGLIARRRGCWSSRCAAWAGFRSASWPASASARAPRFRSI